MPIYEYRCDSCRAIFSRLQRVGAGPEGVRCPSCDHVEVHKLVSSFAAANKPDLAAAAAPGCAGST